MRKKHLIERDKKNYTIACFLNYTNSWGTRYEKYNQSEWKNFRFHSDWNWLHNAWEKFRDTKVELAHFLKHQSICESLTYSISNRTISESFEELFKAVEWYNNLNKQK